MAQRIPVLEKVDARVVKASKPRVGSRWQGVLVISIRARDGEKAGKVGLLMPSSIARWLRPGEHVKVFFYNEPEEVDGLLVAPRESYRLWRVWEGDEVEVWPPWSREERLPRRSPVTGRVVYEYRVLAREAVSEEDYMSIVELEQHHYASKEEVVAIWRCPVCGMLFESNVQPICPRDGVPAKLQEVRGSLPSSRFMVVELVSREPYEPRIVAYVRVDTPIPLMHRRIEGREEPEKMIREKVFPKDWFHPTFWPLSPEKRRSILARYRELAKYYGSKRLARAAVGEEIADEALARANTAAARIARVVVHPDYRGDGLGVLAVRMALEWIATRRIPEMKRKKHVVETIAQMARFNPFFEKAGFYYMWDTASGRPVLMYPLTKEAREIIERFLREDPYARRHGGRLYRSRLGRVEALSGPIVLKGVTKKYSSVLDVEGLRGEVREVLEAFGAERRRVERYIFRGVNLRVESGEVVVVVGASGAGKTTLLRLVIGAATGSGDERYRPDEGEITVPSNTRIAYMLPGEEEPLFGDETILEHVYTRIGDIYAAVELLNAVGLSDAIFYRARFQELSTGQKERAKLASLLSTRPNLVVVDEFAAHLDTLTAQRVARKLSKLVREMGITLMASTHRPEVIRAMEPDKVLLVGYGTVAVLGREEASRLVGQ